MATAWIVGVASTRFQLWPTTGFRELAEQALDGVLEDAGLPDGHAIQRAWSANCAMGVWGQGNIRGQVALTQAMRDGRLPARLPITNVEAGCATGSVALHDAIASVSSGQCDLALALGVEKTLVPDDPAKTFGLFNGGIDQLHPDEWRTFVKEQATAHGLDFSPHPARVVFLDIHALQARYHMAQHGDITEGLAWIAAKNHLNGSLNPLAQRHRPSSTAPTRPTAEAIERVRSDKPIVAPLTRAMCAPISDGAAAVLVASSEGLERLDAKTRARAIAVRGTVQVGGTWRDLNAPSVTDVALEQVRNQTGISPGDLDLAEVHDATAWCEVAAVEALGICKRGQGAGYSLSGATLRDGELPINPSGGLIAKGHPLGATGLGMIGELTQQLRGEAGAHQVPGEPSLGLAHNAGGMIGMDEALCAVTVLEKQ